MSGSQNTSGPKPGDVLKILEANYMYGVGDLVLRVTCVGAMQRLPDGEWLDVTGVQIAWNGVEVGERRVLVRLGGPTRTRGRP